MTTTTGTDRIEQTVELRAPVARVWRALTTTSEFGTWFRARLDGEFVEGATLRGHITYPGYEHLRIEMRIERIEPQTRFAFRWHPYAVDPAADYSDEPMTLVEFLLEPTQAGARLTVIESGFDRLPLARRAEAFRMNEGGWTEQMQNIARHVSQS
jgi:uncharacterized protein YndB with AHSA1/START domain